jgi:hypothetical protein
MMTSRRFAFLGLALLAGACAPSPPGSPQPAPSAAAAAGTTTLDRLGGLARLADPCPSPDLLDRIVGQGFYCSSILMRDPWMDSIRGRSRFAEVVRRADERTREAHDEFIRLDGHRLLALNA